MLQNEKKNLTYNLTIPSSETSDDFKFIRNS